MRIREAFSLVTHVTVGTVIGAFGGLTLDGVHSHATARQNPNRIAGDVQGVEQGIKQASNYMRHGALLGALAGLLKGTHTHWRNRKTAPASAPAGGGFVSNLFSSVIGRGKEKSDSFVEKVAAEKAPEAPLEYTVKMPDSMSR